MPPKAKITKEMILDIVLDMTRVSGFETINARSIAGKLQCSTRPIFTCYKNMEELKTDFLAFAYEYYEQYVITYRNSQKVKPYLILPLSYIAFAQEETHLFKLLFINDIDLKMTEAKDFYQEIGNENKARLFSETIGVELECAKIIFLDLYLYTHGIAVLIAGDKIKLNRENTGKMIDNVLSAFIRQEKDRNISF